MYLLDTDILSNLARRLPSSVLVARLAQVPPELQFTSSITLGEMVYGAYRQEGRTQALIRRIEEVIGPELTILQIDADAARRYGSLRAQLERQGTPIGDADTRIAAIALTHDLMVITANTRHFQRVPGLTVENWLL